jgi:membrane protease YdiL (CAAX protease family)
MILPLVQALIGLIQSLLIIAFCASFYRLKHKKIAGFFNYMGIKKAPRKSILYALGFAFLSTGCSLAVFSKLNLQSLILNPNTLAGVFQNSGFNLVWLARWIVFAWIGTALWEELLFRGFLAKRLINRLGFFSGNTIHALLFGLMHTAAYSVILPETSSTGYIVLTIVPTLMAFAMAYFNEKMFNKSILPGYLIHAFVNAFTPLAAVVFF